MIFGVCLLTLENQKWNFGDGLLGLGQQGRALVDRRIGWVFMVNFFRGYELIGEIRCEYKLDGVWRTFFWISVISVTFLDQNGTPKGVLSFALAKGQKPTRPKVKIWIIVNSKFKF